MKSSASMFRLAENDRPSLGRFDTRIIHMMNDVARYERIHTYPPSDDQTLFGRKMLVLRGREFYFDQVACEVLFSGFKLNVLRGRLSVLNAERMAWLILKEITS